MKQTLFKMTYLVTLVCLAAGCSRFIKKGSSTFGLNTKPGVSNGLDPNIYPENYFTASGKKPQFVLLAFDGSYSLDMWGNTLNFAEQMKAQGTSVKFTYFLSGVYFLNYRKAYRYIPPDGIPGHSLIGFGSSNKDIEKRVAFVNRALGEGHEIGSHLNGHFNGSGWTKDEWNQEFDSFNNLIFSIPTNNNVSPADAGRFTLNITPGQITGFRAPELGTNPALYQVLKERGFTYDTSKVGKEDAWPTKDEAGLWEFPLVQINYASTTTKNLSMDYNFYFRQSNAKDVAVKGSALWDKFYTDTFTSYINYFNNNYNTNRAPIYVGSHFSLWNDGVYWEAMRDFAAAVCGKPEVYCVTFGELRHYMENQTKK